MNCSDRSRAENIRLRPTLPQAIGPGGRFVAGHIRQQQRESAAAQRGQKRGLPREFP